MPLTSKRKAGEDTGKDIGVLPNALLTVCFNVISDDVENDWTEVERGLRSGRSRQVQIRARHAERTTEVASCRRVQDPEASDESTP